MNRKRVCELPTITDSMVSSYNHFIIIICFLVISGNTLLRGKKGPSQKLLNANNWSGNKQEFHK